MNTIIRNEKIKVCCLSVVIMSVLLAGVFMQSCNTEDDIEFTQEQKEVLKESSFIGKEHNRNMQKIFDQLNVKAKLKKTEDFRFTKNNIFQVFKAATEVVLEESATNDLDKKYIQDASKRYFSDRHSQIRTKSNSPDSFYSSIIEDKISKNLLNLVQSLIDISENQQLSIKAQKIKVDKLNQMAFSSLNKEELKIFLAGSSIACASFEYWHTNINDWKTLVLGAEIPRLKGDYNETHNPYDHWLMEGMIEADIKGGVEGAIGGAAVGALLGAGAGAIPGAVASAVAGSSLASIDQLASNIWSHYF
jgi:hypothetical protein